MTHESGLVSRESLGVLEGCLVEGDPVQRTRERKIRRRALILSVALQGLVMVAIVLVPLLGKPARIALANVMPLPPYYSRPAPRHSADVQPVRSRPPQNVCRFCAPRAIPRAIVTHDPTPDRDVSDVPFSGAGIEMPGAIPLVDSRVPAGPAPPPRTDTPHVVHVTHINPAMLTHRIEPVYPTLARQIGRAGRVELRAIIGADGSIESLEAVAGDPMFFQSALEAVRQWRYTPTLLNGQQVEVDTYITVIYNLQR
jgi:protein TonB